MPGQGNFLYCSEVCKIINSRQRSSSSSNINGEKRNRTTKSVQNNSQNPLDEMSREDMIKLIKNLKEERETHIQEKECIIKHTKEVEIELTGPSIKIKLANKLLEKFFNDEKRSKAKESFVEVGSQQGKSYAAAASKSVTSVTKLNPEVDTSNLNAQQRLNT